MKRKKYIIERTLIPQLGNHRITLSDHETGEADPIGQILIQMGHNPDGMRLPSDLKQVVFPFTIILRKRFVDTPITQELTRILETADHTYEQSFIDALAPFMDIEFQWNLLD